MLQFTSPQKEKYRLHHQGIRAVIPKVCSKDHKCSARFAQVVRQIQYKLIFCASRTTKIFEVLRALKSLGNTDLGSTLAFFQIKALLMQLYFRSKVSSEDYNPNLQFSPNNFHWKTIQNIT